jgi:chromosome segregation ATPase
MKSTIKHLKESIEGMRDNLKYVDTQIEDRRAELARQRAHRDALADRIDEAEQAVAILEEASR